MEAPADSNLSTGDLVVAVVWRPDYDQAADGLTQADTGWLAQLMTRRVTPEAWPLTLRKGPGGNQDRDRHGRHGVRRDAE